MFLICVMRGVGGVCLVVANIFHAKASTTPVPTPTPTSETWDLYLTMSAEVRGTIFPVNKWGTMCSLDDLEDDACDCYGGVARRQGVMDRNRARAEANGADHLALDEGAYFFGSGLFYPSFKGVKSAKYFAKSDYDAFTWTFRDFTVAATDGKDLAKFVDWARARDPSLPPAVVTNLNTSVMNNRHLNASHFSSYTITTLDSGRRVAVLALCDPSWMTVKWQGFFFGYHEAVEMALEDLRRLPAAEAPDAVILMGRIAYNDALELATQRSGLAAVIYWEDNYYYTGGGKKPEDFPGGVYLPQMVTSWAGDSVLFTPSQEGMYGTLLQGSLTLKRDGNAPFASTQDGSSVQIVNLNCSVPENKTTYADMVSDYKEMQTKLNATVGYLGNYVEGDKCYTGTDDSWTGSECANPTLTWDGDELCGCRVAECLMGNMITDGVKSITGADISLVNGGGKDTRSIYGSRPSFIDLIRYAALRNPFKPRGRWSV